MFVERFGGRFLVVGGWLFSFLLGGFDVRLCGGVKWFILGMVRFCEILWDEVCGVYKN